VITARALTLALVLVLTTAATAAAQAPRPPGWAPAPAPACPTNAECGVLAPPLVDADPLGQSPRATYALLRATEQPSQGTVVFNPGGPGMSAIQYAKETAEWLGTDFDLLAVDPRGVGASGALTCGIPDDVFIRPFPAQLDALSQCGHNLGDRATAYGTVAAADDLEAIRERLHIPQLDLYGQSYGTTLMTTYARRHPASVRSMLLSGATTFTSDPWMRDRGQAMRRAFRLLCARSFNRCDGELVVRDIARLGRALRQKPIRFDLQWQFRQYPQKLDEIALVYIVLNASYEPRRLARLPGIVREALTGRPARLIRLARRDSLSSASLSALAGSDAVMLRYAVTCHESKFPYDPGADAGTRLEQYVDELDAVRRVEPFSADAWAKGAGAGGLQCLDWPEREPAAPVTGGYPKVPTLVVNGDLDWVTPTSTARKIAAEIPGARFVEVRNVGHVPEVQDSSGCVGDIYWGFLRRREVTGLDCLEHVPAVQVR
jgi:pimeloyl-ACP methyl ester carboxylesterase